MHTRLLSPFVFPVLCSAALAQWHQAATVSPPPRTFPALGVHLGTGQVVMFGGMRTAAPLGSFAETWTWDGSGWTQQFPANAPSARSGAVLVYDLARNVTVLYGGQNPSPIGGLSLSDTWEWDGTNWTQIATAHNAGARGRYMAAYDVARGRTVLYGGMANSMLVGALNGTWEYTGVDWTQVTTAASPGPLQDAAMCYDLARQRTVMFGGSNQNTGVTDTTWRYDGVNWTQVAVSGPRPPGRWQAQMVFDTMRNVCVMHGGADNNGVPFDDTWAFDGTRWTQLHGAATPPQRAFGFAFDPLRAVGVVFGGTNSSVIPDTFVYDGALVTPFGSGCPGSSGVPQLAATAGPRLGLPFQVTLTNLLPSMPVAAVATGFSATSYNGVPLPADASPLGITGCTLYVALDMIDLPSAASGTAVHSVTVPINTALVGVSAFMQGASLDPGVNPFGAVLSNALSMTIGW